tara:strand:- start:288 stop:860 length:573 start_codon:yes stop_codon:yes gene_type:complete
MRKKPTKKDNSTNPDRWIIDNFLPLDVYKPVENWVTSEETPWYRTDGVVHEGDGRSRFIHMLYGEHGITSNNYAGFEPVFAELNVKPLIRAKLNLDLRHEKIGDTYQHHVDHGYRAEGNCFWTCILNFSDCNGATIFESDGAPVKSKRNRAIIFRSHLAHAGCPQTDSLFRYVLNVNYLSGDQPGRGNPF